jgi:dipeptidyl aminopeptidase/acylaminoacyl peptidase
MHCALRRRHCRTLTTPSQSYFRGLSGILSLVLVCAGCSSIQRMPWTPQFSCGSLSSFSNAGLYESAQVGFVSDGLKIGALLTKPKGDGPFPVYVHNHGAMTRQQAAQPLWKTPGEIETRLTAAGYVVLRLARRGYLGSEGVATTYWVHGSSLRVSEIINGAYDEARDVNAAVEYLAGCPFVDRTRITVGGHSVGGLVSVIAAAKNPGLAALISVNGGIGWTQNGRQVGFPAVSAVWRAEAEHLNAPVLLLHGQNDVVVTPDLSRELAELLRQRNAPVTLKIFPGDHSTFPIDQVVNFLDATVKAH